MQEKNMGHICLIGRSRVNVITKNNRKEEQRGVIIPLYIVDVKEGSNYFN